MESGRASMRSLASPASFASSRQSRLTSIASSASLAVPSFTRLNRPEAVAITLSELYKKHGNVSKAAHAYKKLVRQQTRESEMAAASEAEDEQSEAATQGAVEATSTLMAQMSKEVEKAIYVTAHQVSHLHETQASLNSMLAQLEMMTRIWSRTHSALPAQP